MYWTRLKVSKGVVSGHQKDMHMQIKLVRFDTSELY